MVALHRMVLGVAYHGVGFHGWQTQPDGNTVQDYLENALSQFANEPISTICAGRTDTGVHGLGQVVHFDTQADRSLASWVRGVNALLPERIRVRWSKRVDHDFHARFSATARTYVYVLRNEKNLAPSWVGRAGWDFHPLNTQAMQEAAKHLVGQHDFTSFRSSICQAASPIRTLSHVSIEQKGVFIIFTLKANAFLHHMVRNIIGALVYVGKERFDSEWLITLLEKKDRRFSAPTFMPDGLYLACVDYPEQYQLNAQQFDMDRPLYSLLQS